jgi:hypothetical protein
MELRLMNFTASTASDLPASEACLVAVQDEVYLLGGHHGWLRDRVTQLMGAASVTPCACVMIWSPRANMWRAGPVMNVARQTTTACEHNGSLYVFGGLASNHASDGIASAETYSPPTSIRKGGEFGWANTRPGGARGWKLLPSMPVTMHAGQAVSVDEKIYVVSGSSGAGPTFTDLIQVYDTKLRCWSILQTLLPQRECYPVAFEGKIFCF